MSTTQTRETKQRKQDQSNVWSRIAIFASSWWPLCCIIVLFILAGIAKYLSDSPWLLGLSLDLIKAIGVLAVVVYAIHTRQLSVDTCRMAQATIDMHDIERGAVIVSLFESEAQFSDLPREAQDVVKDLHSTDKNMKAEEFSEATKKACPAVVCKIENKTKRHISLSKVEFSIRHTGKTVDHTVACDLSTQQDIEAWNEGLVPLAIAPEGEIAVGLATFQFLDGGVVNECIIQTSKCELNRIRYPRQLEASN